MDISFDVPDFSYRYGVMLLILNDCKGIDLALSCFQLIINVLISAAESHLKDFLLRLSDLRNDFFSRLTMSHYEKVK
jgi:hypothetical protein